MASVKYTTETLQKALKDIRDGVMSVKKASKTYNIPVPTLYDKKRKKYKDQDRTGAPTALSPTEESVLVEWIMTMAQVGFPVPKELLIHSVHKLVTEPGRINKFKKGYPGRRWLEGFLKRNPSVAKILRRPLASATIDTSEKEIRAWFRRVQQHLQENYFAEVLKDPSRIFNCDEFAFFLCPEGRGVLAKTGLKKSDDDKECLSLLLGSSADGRLMPTLALFPYKRIPVDILNKYPRHWSIISDNGWMTSEIFYEYITNVFNPFLSKENIQRPVILFLDRNFSYISFHLCKLCNESGIILIALFPSSIHALQPMDVEIFYALKEAWGQSVYEWRFNNNGRRLKTEDFGPLVKKSVEKTVKRSAIKNGFRKCGLYPFDENGVDYSQLLINFESFFNLTSHASSMGLSPHNSIRSTTQISSDFVTQFEEFLGVEKLLAFEQCSGEWNGDLSDENLYNFWREMRENSNRCTGTIATPDSLHWADPSVVVNGYTLTEIKKEPGLNI